MMDWNNLSMNEKNLSTEMEKTVTDIYLSFLKPNYPQWIAFAVTETILLVICSYLMLAFIFFTFKTMTKEESPSTKPGGHRLRRTRNILLSLLVFYAAASVFKLCLAQWAYWGPDIVTSTEHCVLIGQLFQVSVIIGTTALFLLLWLRQHSLQEGTKYLTDVSPHVMRFSWFLLGVIFLVSAASLAAVIYTNVPEIFRYIGGTNACTYAEATGTNSYIILVGYIIVVVVQGCILYLFVYALRRSVKKRSMIQNDRLSSKGRYRRSYLLIRNCTIAAAVSTASNIIVVAIDLKFKGSVSQFVNNAVWDFDNVISLASIVFCFTNWKQLLFPWPCFELRFQPLPQFGTVTDNRKETNEMAKIGSTESTKA